MTPVFITCDYIMEKQSPAANVLRKMLKFNTYIVIGTLVLETDDGIAYLESSSTLDTLGHLGATPEGHQG